MTGDQHSYGFRRERSTADAIEQVRNILARDFCAEWVLEGDIKGCLDPSSHYTSSCGLWAEEVGKSGRYLDSQAFSASAADVHGVKLAALYTLQDGLARDTEQVGGFEHRHVTLGHVLYET